MYDRAAKQLLSSCPPFSIQVFIPPMPIVCSRTSKCQHFSDAERCLEGTWVIHEVRLAVERRFKILEIQEVYQYSHAIRTQHG
jgi:hypothetical protein